MDNVLFTMPSNLRDFLIATAIVQELQIQMVYGASKEPPVREQNMSVTIRLAEQFKYLEPCLQVVKNLVPTFDYSGWNEYSRGEFNNFVEFDFELAKRIAKANKMHITLAFGVKVGTYLNALYFGMFPSRQCNLGPLMLPKKDKQKETLFDTIFNVGIMGYGERSEVSKFCSYVQTNYPELNVTVVDNERLDDPEILIKWTNNQDIVISNACASTYVAASLEKALIEIFPTEEDQWLYNNKNLKHYSSTVGSPTAEYMWYLFESMYAQFSNQEALNVQAG